MSNEPKNEILASLEADVKAARLRLSVAETALSEFKAQPTMHVYASLDEARDKLEDLLRDQAHEGCEGAGNCGADTYTQEFIVDGEHYLGTLSVEYDRHDKTYYYIDRAEFTYALIQPVPA